MAYDIKPHKERKPNTYYNMQKNKNKFNELVKKYNYDPKSKTVEIDGTRTPIRYKHDDGSSDYYSQNRRGVHDVKVQKKDYKKYKKSFVSDNYKGITIRKHALDDDKFNFTVNHENQHAKDASLKRMIEREPRFDTKYGTKVFDKDTRRKIVELKREIRNSKNSDDLDVLINRINKRQELEDLINVSKKKTEEYKTDKNEKRKDKREEFSKKVREYLMHDSSSSNLVKKLNGHDADGGEIYADLGAMKHGKNKEYTMKNQRKNEESMKKYGIGSKEAHNTNVARRETRNDLKKRGLMNYVESFNE